MKVMCIDPGEKTGIAVFQDGVIDFVCTRAPIDLMHMIELHKPEMILLEDSRLQGNIWTANGAGKRIAMKIARDVGRIDAWCTLINAICEKNNIALKSYSPKQKGEKINAEKFKKLFNYMGNTNQHQRDAAMLIFAGKK